MGSNETSSSMFESGVFGVGEEFPTALTSAFTDGDVDGSGTLLSELVARTTDDPATAAPMPELVTVFDPLLCT
jgi:hypothetical protein